jgi:hypothetical protein
MTKARACPRPAEHGVAVFSYRSANSRNARAGNASAVCDAIRRYSVARPRNSATLSSVRGFQCRQRSIRVMAGVRNWLYQPNQLHG